MKRLSCSPSEVVTQFQAVLARWCVYALVNANEARQVEVVNPVPLVRRVLDEGIDLPPVVSTAKADTRIDDGVGGLKINRRVDQLEVLPAVPLDVAFD